MTVPYFAYGTTQRGFPHHSERQALLGEPVGRFRTVAAHGVVVPREPACSNPGCRYVHRMAVLVAGHWDLHAEGEVFLIADEAVAELDALELSGPYVRATIEVAGAEDGRRYAAQAYPAREPDRWAELVHAGRADALRSHPLELAAGDTLKPCCSRAPGHAAPHDTLDPLRADLRRRPDPAA